MVAYADRQKTLKFIFVVLPQNFYHFQNLQPEFVLADTRKPLRDATNLFIQQIYSSWLTFYHLL